MIAAKAGLVIALFGGGALEAFRGGLEWVVLVVAAATALAVIWRGARKLAHAVERIADGTQEMLGLVKGDRDQPGLAARLEGLEREVSSFRKTTQALTELARDEHVADVRDLLRRGHVPQPLLEEDDTAKSGW